MVSLGGDINRDAGFARNQQRLVAEIFCCAIGIDQKWKRGVLPAVAAREHIDLYAARGESFGKGDGERSLACPARGEIADADDGPAQAADRLEPGAQLEFAQGEAEPVDRNERP